MPSPWGYFSREELRKAKPELRHSDAFLSNHRDRFSPGSIASSFTFGILRSYLSRCVWKSLLSCIVYCGIQPDQKSSLATPCLRWILTPQRLALVKDGERREITLRVIAEARHVVLRIVHRRCKVGIDPFYLQSVSQPELPGRGNGLVFMVRAFGMTVERIFRK